MDSCVDSDCSAMDFSVKKHWVDIYIVALGEGCYSNTSSGEMVSSANWDVSCVLYGE